MGAVSERAERRFLHMGRRFGPCSRSLTAADAVIDCHRPRLQRVTAEARVKASCGAFAAVLEVGPFVVGQKLDDVAPQP